MPSGLTLPNAGQVIQVESLSGSTAATEATVLPGNVVQILDLVSSGTEKPAGSVFELTIGGITNQNSVRDAGSWEIKTMN